MKRFPAADESYRQAIALNAELPWAHYNRGVTLVYLGRPEEALGEFQSVMDAAGGQADPPVFFNLGLAHALLGHRQEAIASLREFLRQWPAEDVYRRQALDLLQRLEK